MTRLGRAAAAAWWVAVAYRPVAQFQFIRRYSAAIGCPASGESEPPICASSCGGWKQRWVVIGLLSRIQCKSMLHLVGAELPIPAEGRCGYTVMAPLETTGIGTARPDTERSCVLTITITAPQQVHRIGERFLNQSRA